MLDLSKIIEDIVAELTQLHNSPQPKSHFPSTLGLGDGRFLEISDEIDRLIADFSRQKMNADTSLKTRFVADDFRRLVRDSFGSVLAKIDLDDDLNTNSEIILTDVEATIKEKTDWISTNGSLEYAFGCTLFSYDDIAPFDIGPACFEPRLIWLDRKASDGRRARVGSRGWIERFDPNIADGPVSKVTKRRIARIWSGEKLKNRKGSADSRHEKDIISAIGNCPYVCSIKIPGFGGKAGQDKALISARLALATISLVWEKPSKALNGLNLLFDREARVGNTLSFTAHGLVLGGSIMPHMPHGPWVERDQLEQYFQEFSGKFSVAGEAIDWFLNPSANDNRPTLMNIIAQAMLWFHDGCREITDLKAIVSFASCMDILASGGGRESISKLICARLGTNENTQIHRDGFTVKEVINQIYDEGRTRFIHGPMRNGSHVWEDKLGHDWSETRELAESLARMCLVCCLDWLNTNPTLDDPKRLLE